MSQRQFCIRGHDTYVVGRNGRRRCRTCRNDYEMQRARHGSAARSNAGCECSTCEEAKERARMRTPSMPIAPLLEFIPASEWVHDGHTTRVGGITTILPKGKQRQFFRAMARGALTPAAADEIAVALHMHPMEIWGDEWLA